MIQNLILIAALLGAQPTSTPTEARTHDGLAELRALPREESLYSLRAGAPALPQTIAADEREILQAAANASENLAAYRAGVMDDHDWQIVLVVLVAVLIVVIIA